MLPLRKDVMREFYHSAQATNLIGCNDTTLKKMVAEGLIKDQRGHKPGQKKHFAQLDKHDVDAIAAVYTRRMKMRKLKAALRKSHVEIVKTVHATIKEARPSVAGGIMSRLDAIEKKLDTIEQRILKLAAQQMRLEEKLDKLVALWS